MAFARLMVCLEDIAAASGLGEMTEELMPLGSGTGDLGYCQQLCDDVTECHDTVHQMSCNTSAKAKLGHGYCEIVGPVSTSDGGTDAALDAAGD